MFHRRATALIFALLPMSACRSNVSWVPGSDGRLVAMRQEPVRLPGLTYLALGQARHEAVAALRTRGFECSDEAASSRSQACVRPPGAEEPTGGVVMLSFDQGALAGVQAQLQPEGDDSGKVARKRYEAIQAEWTQAFGRSQEIRRPGIVAARHSLPNGTALLAVWYDGDPTLIVEHVQVQLDTVRIPPPPRDTGTR
jgi:hypothetical protein